MKKTRELLIEEARNLFAKNGVEETTMNDIAVASGKGRRTLYTYFKNKEEIYIAVVQSELARMSERMKEVAAKPIDPEDKLVQLVFLHLSLIKQCVKRNGSLRAAFFRDIWRVENVRKDFDRNEIELLTRVVMQGIRVGRFDISNIRLSVDIIHYCIKGLEIPYIFGRLGDGMKAGTSRPLVQRIIHRALANVERPDEKSTAPLNSRPF